MGQRIKAKQNFQWNYRQYEIGFTCSITNNTLYKKSGEISLDKQYRYRGWTNL